MEANKGSVAFHRKANPSKDCVAVGSITAQHELYVHSWKTGHQELIFESQAHAKRFAEINECDFRGPTKH
jgi:hypothetical protein